MIEIIFLYNIEKLWLIFLFALIFPLILLSAKMTNQLFLPRQNKIPMWKIDIYFLSLFFISIPFAARTTFNDDEFWPPTPKVSLINLCASCKNLCVINDCCRQ